MRLIKKHLMRESGEEIRQDVAAQRQAPFHMRRKKKAASEQNEDEESESGEEGEAKPVATEKMMQAPGYDLIKDKLNVIRSGKSLDNEEVATQLHAYFDVLTDAEKIGLFAYLKAFAEIISGGEEAEKVDEPSDNPYRVKMVLKRQGADDTGEARPAEEPKSRTATAQDAPIVVGEAATGKGLFKKLLAQNRR